MFPDSGTFVGRLPENCCTDPEIWRLLQCCRPTLNTLMLISFSAKLSALHFGVNNSHWKINSCYYDHLVFHLYAPNVFYPISMFSWLVCHLYISLRVAGHTLTFVWVEGLVDYPSVFLFLPRFNNDDNNRIERGSWRFFTISSLCHGLSPTCMLLWPGAIMYKSCAAHRVLVMCNMSCGKWYKGTVQLLSLTELKWYLL